MEHRERYPALYQLYTICREIREDLLLSSEYKHLKATALRFSTLIKEAVLVDFLAYGAVPPYTLE